MVTLGELASGQAGGDPGDQISLNSTGSSGPDWLQLNYAGSGQVIALGATQFVVYEISSSTSGVDTEGTSWQISFNGGSLQPASSSSVAVNFATPGAENVNMLVFDLLSSPFNFSLGDMISTVYIENVDTGSTSSDPDFIFAGITTSAVVPTPSAALAGLFMFGGLAVRRRRRAD